MRPGRKLKPGDHVSFGERLSAEILEKKDGGVTEIRFEFSGVFEEILDELGQNAPAAVHHREAGETRPAIKTVYAKENGSAAAPTAGLHFTPELLKKISWERECVIAPVLLHVGLGTFRPVKVDDVEQHTMHSEYYSVSKESADAINRAKENGGRVIAVGTTSVRTLESVSDENGHIEPQSGHTNIFIYPGYRMECVDSLITNFHLPESTLIMLVAAMTGEGIRYLMYTRRQ